MVEVKGVGVVGRLMVGVKGVGGDRVGGGGCQGVKGW